MWRPPTHSSTQPTCGEGPSRTWPRCAWLCRMPQSHLPSPRLPTTWQCPRTRLPGPWWARSQPLTWTPRPVQSGELGDGLGQGLASGKEPRAGYSHPRMCPSYCKSHSPPGRGLPPCGSGGQGKAGDLANHPLTLPIPLGGSIFILQVPKKLIWKPHSSSGFADFTKYFFRDLQGSRE